jgi:hypothetical protein
MVALNPISVGIDVGKMVDPTAIAVAELESRHDGRWHEGNMLLSSLDEVEHIGTSRPVLVTHYMLRHIERLPLGTSYPAVAKRIAAMLCNPLFYRRQVQVLIDVTGVGRPVYDDLVEEASLHAESRDAQILPITFAPGQKYNRSTGTLGKAYLVSRLQSLLQNHRIHAPDTPEVKAMQEELKVYEIRIDRDGHDTYGAFKIGKHDDLATALGLAVLEDGQALAPLDDETMRALLNYRGY